MSKDLEKLWERVAYYRELSQEGDEDAENIEQLERAWKAAYKNSADLNDFVRGNENRSQPPLKTIADYVSFGVYPPPELMHALVESFYQYLEGEKGIEEAFFGRPIPGSGNYAKRWRREEKNVWIQTKFRIYLRKGLSPIEAAEKVVVDLDLNIEPESVLRMCRRT